MTLRCFIKLFFFFLIKFHSSARSFSNNKHTFTATTAINNRETIRPPSFVPTSSAPLINHRKVNLRTHTIYYFQQNISDLASTLPSISVDINTAYLQFWLCVIYFSRNRSIRLKQGSCSLDHHFGGFGKPLTQYSRSTEYLARWAFFIYCWHLITRWPLTQSSNHQSNQERPFPSTTEEVERCYHEVSGSQTLQKYLKQIIIIDGKRVRRKPKKGRRGRKTKPSLSASP